jgi:hypothetical protein
VKGFSHIFQKRNAFFLPFQELAPLPRGERSLSFQVAAASAAASATPFGVPQPETAS